MAAVRVARDNGDRRLMRGWVMAGSAWRRSVRTGAGLVVVLLVLMLALLSAWILSNRFDIEPVAPPAALTIPAPTVPDDRNAFFPLAGLLVVDGAAAPAGRLTTLPSACDDIDRCVESWLADLPGLAAGREAAAVAGRRCEALLARGDVAFEERLPPLRDASVIVSFAPHAIGATTCSTWLLGGAVLAWHAGRAAEALDRLRQAIALSRALLQGSQSLIGRVVATAIASRTLMVTGELALRDPDIAQAVQPLLAPPWLDPADSIRRWVAVEASFQRAVFRSMAREPAPAVDWSAIRVPPPGPMERLTSRVMALLSTLGFQPERTIATNDARWMRLLDGLPDDADAWAARLRAMAATSATSATSAADGSWRGLSWQNPFGQRLLADGERTYDADLVRDIDLLLRQQAVRLAIDVRLAGVPAPQRAAWSTAQPLPDEFRQRLHWLDGGERLAVDTWAATLGVRGPVNAGPQVRIRFADAPPR